MVGWCTGSAYWLAQFGLNLNYYGLDVGTLMSSTLMQKSLREMSAFDRNQIQLRQEIQELAATLASTRDQFVQMKLEAEIKSMAGRIVAGDDETFSVSDLIKKTRENKRIDATRGQDKDILSGIHRRVQDTGGTRY